MVVVGTGFASTFFLHGFLPGAPASTTVLVLERGGRVSHAEQLGGSRERLEAEASASIRNLTPAKPWRFLNAFGGGSNCWSAATPRLTPADFRIRSAFGVGRDWPITYDDLEPYYAEAEHVLAVAGPADGSPYPRSSPYPQPPHRFSDVDLALKEAYPDRFFQQPCARPVRATTRRQACCGNGVCDLCPIDAKFTILNEMAHVYEDARVSLELGARVIDLETSGGDVVTGVRYRRGGEERIARGDLVVLGANALFNPHLLLRSGIVDGRPGEGLVEQVSRSAVVHLDGIDNFGGSAMVTGLGYMLHDRHRGRRAAALIESHNSPLALRPERGKWRQLARLRVICEDHPQPGNAVGFDPATPDRPTVRFAARSAPTEAALASLESDLAEVLAPLPVERILLADAPNPTEAHIQCTTPMGSDPAGSVVDRDLMHHRLRNLAVLGSGAFPTAAPANPTLTICALSLRFADHVGARGGAAAERPASGNAA